MLQQCWIFVEYLHWIFMYNLGSWFLRFYLATSTRKVLILVALQFAFRASRAGSGVPLGDPHWMELSNLRGVEPSLPHSLTDIVAALRLYSRFSFSSQFTDWQFFLIYAAFDVASKYCFMVFMDSKKLTRRLVVISIVLVNTKWT